MLAADAQSDDQGLLLTGLDGSNPLGFLAAVGTLRTVGLAAPDARWSMKWLMRDGIQVPALSADQAVSADALVDLLCCELRRESTPEFDFAENLNITPGELKNEAAMARSHARPDDRRHADFIAAFGCEICEMKDGKSVQDTALRTMSGAGHQHFLGTMKQLTHKTERAHLHNALFEMWRHSDDKLGLRWDPEEDRRYALRWDNPSDGGGVKTVRGANRLAIEALPMLPTAPGERDLQTTGFSTQRKAVLFTWPIWQVALGVDVVRSLLALPELQRPEPNREHLAAMGVSEVHRSQRVTVGKYRNFTRALPV